jgi:hypothetical protein
MFEPFSGGYYVGELYVESRRRDGAAVSGADYETMREFLYGVDDRPADGPVVVPLEHQHNAVGGEDGLPDNTLVVPEQRTDVSADGERRGVLVAKADRAQQLLKFTADAEPSGVRRGSGAFVPDALGRFPGPDASQ